MSKLLAILLLLSAFLPAQGQNTDAEKKLLAGNELYKKEQFEEAAVEFRAALAQEPHNKIAKFNLANTLYKLRKENEALKLFSELAATEDKKTDLPDTWYNKGVVQSRLKELEASIASYKSALRTNPSDKEARENLQKALLELKKKDPPKKEQENKKNPQSKLNPRDVDRRLNQLEQKEKEVQQRLQKEKSKSGGGQDKDW